jgi:hypothetical protein
VNRDFAEMLSELSAAGVEFLVIGAHARAAYGEPRATKDLDIWVRPSVENARRVLVALARFGAPMANLSVDDFSAPDMILQLGFPPYRIDIITKISGVDFDEAWPHRIQADFGGAMHPVIGKREFIRNKRAAGRPQDLVDAEHIEKSPIE